MVGLLHWFITEAKHMGDISAIGSMPTGSFSSRGPPVHALTFHVGSGRATKRGWKAAVAKLHWQDMLQA